MKVSLVNPAWDFAGSIYFGCREPHLPIELGAAKLLLERAGHQVQMLDGSFDRLSPDALASAIADFRPDMTVITTAPTYLFWRCAPPELRVPRALIVKLDGRGGRIVAIGPHGTSTPGAVLHKLGADLVIRGEAEEAILALAEAWPHTNVPGSAVLEDGELRLHGAAQSTDFTRLTAIQWPETWIARHRHHHHRFDRAPDGPGAEVEASRGCPYSCSFCAKIDFRDAYRRRALPELLTEIDALIDQDVGYVYFIDEIFLPQPALLEALAKRPVRFGVQTRLDLWKPALIEMLGRAGCVSIEAGVESLTESGRAALDKDCRLDTDQLTDRLLLARRHVPFVQANLIATQEDEPEAIFAWREKLRAEGVWANDPVPMFPYPGSPDYRNRWGPPDDDAWERALDHYLEQFEQLSDLQDSTPLKLRQLESECLP